MEDTQLLAGISLFFCMMGAIFFIVLLVIVCLWRIFNKAGKPGFYALIPLVSPFQWAKISGRGDIFAFFYVILVTFFGTEIFVRINEQRTEVNPFALVAYLGYAYVCLGLAQRFGKSTLFGLGLLFLPFVFYPILAFGSATYRPASA